MEKRTTGGRNFPLIKPNDTIEFLLGKKKKVVKVKEWSPQEIHFTQAQQPGEISFKLYGDGIQKEGGVLSVEWDEACKIARILETDETIETNNLLEGYYRKKGLHEFFGSEPYNPVEFESKSQKKAKWKGGIVALLIVFILFCSLVFSTFSSGAKNRYELYWQAQRIERGEANRYLQEIRRVLRDLTNSTRGYEDRRTLKVGELSDIDAQIVLAESEVERVRGLLSRSLVAQTVFDEAQIVVLEFRRERSAIEAEILALDAMESNRLEASDEFEIASEIYADTQILSYNEWVRSDMGWLFVLVHELVRRNDQ